MSIKLKFCKKNLFYKIVSASLVTFSIIFLSFLLYINLLPKKYLNPIFLIILVFNICSLFLINLKSIKKSVKKVLSVFMIVAIFIMTYASFYMSKTIDVLESNGDTKYKMEHYSIVVLKDSNYNNINDIKGQEIGYFENSTGSKEANSNIENQVSVAFKSYKTSDNLIHDLLDSDIKAIVIEDSIKSIMEEELPEFETSTKVIYNFSIKVDIETTLKEVDVTKEPFAIYVSGIDTYGEISSVSRSDVNIVMVVNPKIRQILLISIPRDYYVQLHGTTGTKDKLTHAGIYGIDMSIKTIEDLLNLNINYYLKVNFTSVIDIVDAIGGLDVYSEYSFISYSGYNFKKGLNSVNGKQALDFARTRKAFIDGDRQRGKNQQAVIEAVIRKVTDKAIITKYNSLLNAINGKYQTNMSTKKIASIIKMQLDDMSPWTVTSHSLTGYDSTDYTYTYNQLLYVMKPDEASVNQAIQLIENVLNNEGLENSYNDLGGSSNKVTQIKPNDNNTSNTENNIGEETPEDDLEQNDNNQDEKFESTIIPDDTDDELNNETEPEEETKNEAQTEDESLKEDNIDSETDIEEDEDTTLDEESNSAENLVETTIEQSVN